MTCITCQCIPDSIQLASFCTVLNDILISFQSLLMEACETGDVGVVQLALEGGADPNQANEVRFNACVV